jgi:hypothetical protein
VEIDERRDVDVCKAVAIGDEHDVGPAQVVLDALHAGAGHRGVAGVGAGHAPALVVAGSAVGDVSGAQVERHVGAEQVVVEEVALDHLPAVAQAEDEVVEAVVRVALHDVPEQRPPADLDHRLGPELGLLAHARALTTAEQDDFGIHAAVNRPRRPPLER